eukprot:8041127-Alexandrium_andersonii.AAC.2
MRTNGRSESNLVCHRELPTTAFHYDHFHSVIPRHEHCIHCGLWTRPPTEAHRRRRAANTQHAAGQGCKAGTARVPAAIMTWRE